MPYVVTVVVSFPDHMTRYPNKTNLEKAGVLLAHSVRGQSIIAKILGRNLKQPVTSSYSS